MFSIVVTCVDRDLNYLENCLKGFLLQSYSDFELIVILNLKKKNKSFRYYYKKIQEREKN